jgi:hypothetical protein
MRLEALAATSPFRLGAILGALCWFGFVCLAGVARADDPSPFLNVDARACAQLDDRNLQVGPPDAEIVAACAAFGRGTVLGQHFSGGLGASALALLGVVLVYAVLGAPLRSAARLAGGAGGRSAAFLAFETALAFVLRAAVALLALAMLGLPYATAVGCVAILALSILALRDSRPAGREIATAPPPSGASVLLADMINDVAGSAPGILGIALLARRDPWWLGAGICLAAVASVPAIVAARVSLRRDPLMHLGATAVLGAIFGAAAFADPDLSDAFGGAFAPAAISAVLFALVVLAADWLLRGRSRSNPAAG